MESNSRRILIADEFERRFGTPPLLWTRAPGRVDLMGSHTDYNMGRVMTMTIDRDTWLAAVPRSDRQIVIQSLNVARAGRFSLDDIRYDDVASWTNYVRGVAHVMQEAGHVLTGFTGLVHSIVPFGSGLSSSAALEMATVTLFNELNGLGLEPVAMALLGQQAENRFVGVNSGILDQYTSAMGRAGTTLLLDCRSLTSRAVTMDARWQVVICDTRAERGLAGSAYDQRQRQCEEGVAVLRRSDPHIRALRDVTLEQLAAQIADLSPVVARRCRFIIEEDRRVLDLADALEAGDAQRVGVLTAASYAGACGLYEICAPPMDAMIAAMRSGPGLIGARQAGAGFGGCMVALVDRTGAAAFVDHVARVYSAATGVAPSIYPVNAAAGAGVIRWE